MNHRVRVIREGIMMSGVRVREWMLPAKDND